MSHDQRPARVRVVGGPAAPPQRRHDDQTDAAVDASTARHANKKAGVALPATLFLIGCAAGGFAIAAFRVAG